MSALGTRQFFRYHPVIGHTFIPGLRARVNHEGGGYLVRVNETGFRCEHEFEKQRQPGVFRALLFGDSFIAGDGVSNRKRFGDVLEQRIPGLEIYNFGISGTGQDQQYLAYQEFARDIEHDLLIIASPIENIARIVARYMKFATSNGDGYRLFPRPYFEVDERGTLHPRHIPVPQESLAPDAIPGEEFVYPAGRREQRRLRELVYRMGPRATVLARRLSRRDPAPQYASADDPAWRLLRAIFEAWIAESPVPVLLFPIPLHQHVEEVASPAGYQARFAELHRPPAVAVHDPLPALLGYAKEERRAFRFENDVHPTIAGHQALAEALEPAIRAQMTAAREELTA